MKIVVGKGSCGIAAGAAKVDHVLKTALENMGNITLTHTGCVGNCYLEPIVDIYEGDKLTRLVQVDEKGASEICKHANGETSNYLDYEISSEDALFLSKQTRIALRNCGLINPENIEEYIEIGGYGAIQDWIKHHSPEAVIETLKIAGIGGRGGAGFPTWFKWNAARNNPGSKKYIICNADEGDPGAFMDRAILEGDPHSLLEGMLFAAFAIGADEGIIYVRAEYPLAIQRLETAIQAATKKGFLGKNIFGSNLNFTMRIKAGAGAFVCGEETALIASLEGERGMPRLKPPFPAEKGYWQRPSNINNVETYANCPWIFQEGGEKFAKIGIPTSRGTKVFALTGKIAKGGLVEVPMGLKIEDVIFDIGGGIIGGKEFKAVQMGGPSGGCIPASMKDTLIDYQELSKTGAIMGSGGMVVMDENTCMVDMARYFLDFTCNESCGKCIHCRMGTKRMLEILERITKGEGKEGDIEILETLSHEIAAGSLCGLGQTASNPVLTTIKYFREEYIDHIVHKKCTAKQCQALITYTIDPVKCTGCTLCARKCPTDVIEGDIKKPHVIHQEGCIKCGNCLDVCRFDAVIVE